MPEFSCIVHPPCTRLDRYVAETLRLLSRSQVKSRGLFARVNGKNAKLSHVVKEGDLLELRWDAEPPSHLMPEDIPLDILYEDDRVVVINKAQGMVVHPGAGNHCGTLANALLFRRSLVKASVPDSGNTVLASDDAPFRAGIVHRLDKDTSGVIIAAYDDEVLAFLAAQFKNRETRKLYAAIVHGTPKETSGIINAPLARDVRDRTRFTVVPERGRSALTRYKLIRSWETPDGMRSLLALMPKTGRTHQLRVHLKHLGHPILGDPIYGAGDPGISLMLHAESLSIRLPGESAPRTFSTPLPPRFLKVLEDAGMRRYS